MRSVILACAVLLAAPALAAERAALDGNAEYTACVALTETKPQEAFDRALAWRDRRNGGVPAEHCLALAVLELGHPIEAAVQLEAIVRKSETRPPGERAAMLNQADNAWLLAKQPRPAEDAFSQALQLSARDATLWLDRARARAMMANWAGADADLSAALAFEKGLPELYVLRASARRALGRKVEADADINAALALDANNPDALVERGVAKLAAGDRNGARQDWILVLRRSPQSAAADSARARLEALDVNPDR